MALLRCTVCLGEYDSIGADGLRYFHQCPPLSPRELRDALDAKTVQLPPRVQVKLAAARAADAAEPRPLGEPTREDQLLDTLAIPRPGARDENIDPAKARARAAERTGANEAVDAELAQLAPGTGAIVLAPDDAL